MKRFLSFWLVFALLLSLAPAHVHGEEQLVETTETEEGYFEQWDAAAAYIRDKLLTHATEFTVKRPADKYNSNTMEGLYKDAVKHTGDPKAGDSLLWQTAPVNCFVKLDAGFVYLHYSILYLTTAEEEAELDSAMDALLAELQCDPEDSYGSVKKIYDWVCANVAYVKDANASRQDHTAYGALINRTASSQGCSLLLYQLLCKLSISCRVVPGTYSGELHYWNVVEVEQKHYNVDAALDAGKEEYAWFLKSDSNFTDHARDSVCFELQIPSSIKDYGEAPVQPDLSHFCEILGHDWVPGDCQKHNYCNLCGLESEEYGPHYFGSWDFPCDRAGFCEKCHELVPPRDHIYIGETEAACIACRAHDRLLGCVGEELKVSYTVPEGSEQPKFSEVPGMTVTALEDHPDGEGGHVWSYGISFAETGAKQFTVTLGGNLEPVVEDVMIRVHRYLNDSSKCDYCHKANESYCNHEWSDATCTTPMICQKCGEAHDFLAPHDFFTTKCNTEPGVCTMCGLIQEEPPGHDFAYDNRCKRCGLEGRWGCTKGGAAYIVSSRYPDGFRLENTDPAVSLTVENHYEENGIYYWEYRIMAQKAGSYDVTFFDEATGNTCTVAAVIREHAYTYYGRCGDCGEVNPDAHFHEYTDVTCTEDSYCRTCGKPSVGALGHDWLTGPCSEPRGCSRCDYVMEAPSHYYVGDHSDRCLFCDHPHFYLMACQGVPNTVILNSGEGGDFYLQNPPEGFSLSILEYFQIKEVYYWEYALYTPGPGKYDLVLGQKNSDQTMGITVEVVEHMFLGGICQICGTREDATHVHTWKNATCKKGAVCTGCGEIEGEPLNHNFSAYTCRESAKCSRCDEKRGKIAHTYDDRADNYCNNCNQYKESLCIGKTTTITLESHDWDGFYIRNKPSGISVKKRNPRTQGNDRGYIHEYELTVKAADNYELCFVDYGGGESFYMTLKVNDHVFEDGGCRYCGKLDPDVHHHNWEYATCLQPKYCRSCGETVGEPLGHDWAEATCTSEKYCQRCGLSEPGFAPHDFVGWSCTEPGVCRNCNALQDKAFGHIYDSDLDEYCNTCGQFRLLGCRDQVLKITLTAATDAPFALVNPETGVSMTLESCLQDGEQYIHTYHVTVPGMGAYELTAAQEGNTKRQSFTVQILDHLYADGFCGRCGAEMKGIPGDVDGDGMLSYNDALTVLRASIGLATLTPEQEALADYDGDGGLSYNDALMILRASIGL